MQSIVINIKKGIKHGIIFKTKQNKKEFKGFFFFHCFHFKRDKVCGDTHDKKYFIDFLPTLSNFIIIYTFCDFLLNELLNVRPKLPVPL